MGGFMQKVRIKLIVGLVVCLVTTQAIAVSFKTGADLFCAAPEKYLKGKKNIAILSQAASIVVRQKRQHRQLVDVVYELSQREKSSFKIKALFVPEYGLDGSKDAYEYIKRGFHKKIKCPIYSLHGEVHTPKREWFEGLDLVIIDLQEVGVRCYTYISTMVKMLGAAAQANVPVLLLDRPNPIRNLGPSTDDGFDEKYYSFLAQIKIPFVHGMTMGEIAKQKAAELGSCDLEVIPAQGNPAKYFAHYFVAPSPNLTSVKAMLCYPLTVMLESTNYSDGRGTSAPFEQFGAPWVDGERLAKVLNAQKLSGVIFKAVEFTPTSMKGSSKPAFKGKACQGVMITISNRDAINPVAVSQAIASTLFALYPKQSTWRKVKKFNYAIDQMMAGPAWREKVEEMAKGLKV
jgi:uncharacterized protein YbbC (DUF1343 family)